MLEPQGPPAPLTDQSREAALIRIRDACTEGRLTLEEFSSRVDLALKAQNQPELDGLLSDISTPLPAPAPKFQLPRAGSLQGWTVSVLGSSNRSGRWRVGHESRVLALLGSCDLDLRSAELEGDELVIQAVSIMGSIRVVVPEGIPVDIEGISIMGSRDMRLTRAPFISGAPRIRIQCLGLMGSITVTNRGGFIRDLIERARGGLGPP